MHKHDLNTTKREAYFKHKITIGLLCKVEAVVLLIKFLVLLHYKMVPPNLSVIKYIP